MGGRPVPSCISARCTALGGVLPLTAALGVFHRSPQSSSSALSRGSTAQPAMLADQRFPSKFLNEERLALPSRYTVSPHPEVGAQATLEGRGRVGRGDVRLAAGCFEALALLGHLSMRVRCGWPVPSYVRQSATDLHPFALPRGQTGRKDSRQCFTHVPSLTDPAISAHVSGPGARSCAYCPHSLLVHRDPTLTSTRRPCRREAGGCPPGWRGRRSLPHRRPHPGRR